MGVQRTVLFFHVENCASGELSGYPVGPLGGATAQRIDPVAGSVTPVGPSVPPNFTDES